MCASIASVQPTTAGAGMWEAVLGEREHALDQAERFLRGLPGPVEDAESGDGQVVGSQVRNRRWRGIWFASCSTVRHDPAAVIADSGRLREYRGT